MSSTELSRLMTEVTAQPPVDVDFAAVARRVQLRRRRQGASISVLAVVVAVLIAVPATMSGAGSAPSAKGPKQLPTTTPDAGPVIDSSWEHASWNNISWRMPTGWLSTEQQQMNMRKSPMGGPGYGPVISTMKVKTCSSPSCGLSSILVHLPVDGVAGQLIVIGGYGGASLPAEDTGTVGSPDQTCQGWGGAATFTSVRHFGTAPYTHAISFSACLGSGQVATAPGQLRALVASEVDASAVTVDATWQTVTAGPLTWQMPSDWGTDRVDGKAAVVIDTSCLRSLTDQLADFSCTPDLPHIPVTGAYLWVSALAAPSSPLAKAKYLGGMPATGACKAAGGQYMEYYDQLHLGPQSGGKILTLAGCVGKDVPSSTGTEISLMLKRVKDANYADPTALCASVPGTVVSAELETVGDIRVFKWGSEKPAIDAFPRSSAADQAAWCWTRDDATQQYVVWAAHQGDPAQRVVSLTTSAYGAGYTPSGAPYSPPPASLAAASAVHHDPGADALCGSRLPGFVSGWLTTVGAIREATWGPARAGSAPLAQAFPGAAAGDMAAWCWTGRAGSYTDYAVHAGDAPVEAVSIRGVPAGVVPGGPPLFP
ncbi:MAG: hypothetical protein QOI76_1273 [Frankiales bacterium]|nr:hypothetical protein [Frankiales bacterium]